MHNPVLAHDWHKQRNLCLESNIHLMRIQPLEETWGLTSSLTVTQTKWGLLRSKTPCKPWANGCGHTIPRYSPSCPCHPFGTGCCHTAPAEGLSAQPSSAKWSRCCWNGWNARTTREDFKSLTRLSQQSHALNASWRWPEEERTEGGHRWRRSAT